jgi:hypothetical protein
LQDVVVPESQDPPSAVAEVGIPRVVIAKVRMLPTVRFDNEPRLDAREIDDVGRNRMLAAESPAELLLAEHIP